eukprot:231994-Rhodomonas_salina.2
MPEYTVYLGTRIGNPSRCSSMGTRVPGHAGTRVLRRSKFLEWTQVPGYPVPRVPGYPGTARGQKTLKQDSQNKIERSGPVMPQTRLGVPMHTVGIGTSMHTSGRRGDGPLGTATA